MRPSTLIVLLPLAATVVSATCYGGGAKGDKGVANDNLDTVCSSIMGYFYKTQHRDACVYKAGQDVSWYFSIERSADTGDTLTHDVCKNGLMTKVEGCDHGGRNKNGDWIFTLVFVPIIMHITDFFRSDPDEGMCSDTQYINDHSRTKRSLAPQHARDIRLKERQPTEGDVKIVYDVGVPARKPVSEKRGDVTIVYDVNIPKASQSMPFQA
jgi:hypothetical protein